MLRQIQPPPARLDEERAAKDKAAKDKADAEAASRPRTAIKFVQKLFDTVVKPISDFVVSVRVHFLLVFQVE